MKTLKARISRLERAHRNNHHEVSTVEGVRIKQALRLKLGMGRIPDSRSVAAVSYSPIKLHGSTVREKLTNFLASRVNQ